MELRICTVVVSPGRRGRDVTAPSTKDSSGRESGISKSIFFANVEAIFQWWWLVAEDVTSVSSIMIKFKRLRSPGARQGTGIVNS